MKKIKISYYRFKYFLIFKVFPLLSNKLNKLTLKSFYDLEIRCGYRNNNGEPLICPYCNNMISRSLYGRRRFFNVNKSFINHDICEYSKHCVDCGKEVGYWSYGSWQL